MQARDLKMLEGIEKHKYLRTDQIAELYFRNIKDKSQRTSKARARLLLLYKAKLLNRTRYPGDPYIYFAKGNKYSHKLQHYLTITDVLLQILDLVPASSKVDYEVEVQLGGGIIADLVIRYQNTFRQERKTYFVEVELNSSGDVIQKVRKYEDLLEDGELVVVAKHPATIKQIQAAQFTIPIQCLPLNNIGIMRFT